METKFVTVTAEKKNGKIIYRGGGVRQKSMAAVILMLTGVMAVVMFAVAIMAEAAFARTPERPQEVAAPVIHDVDVVALCQFLSNPVIEEVEKEQELDENLVEMLALVIYQEAGGDGCSDDTRRMVGEVAMNRVADSRFPDTLEEVLLQKQQYGRLYWTGLVWPERSTYEGEAHAVSRAYDIARSILSGAERLLPEDVIFQAEFRQGTETVAQSDGFYFCR